eukprot:TRINITY_DN665_c0_g1_i1.p1 TRINITY_DN665_c0_g1~~TRINITY_DN665_c0_g1_i1.p1  ORF type:complete len:204 (-),score=35.71 TRINITY_DN665_c0_g1_i1:28-639(-)
MLRGSINSVTRLGLSMASKNRGVRFMSAQAGLDSIADVQLLSKESPSTISQIWIERHKQQECISAVIPAPYYMTMKSRALSAPNFVIPLPRDTGVVTSVYFQAKDDLFLFTSLLDFQHHGKTANPWLTVRHFTELADSKQIVLMRGDPSLGQVSVVESQYLYNQIRLFLLDNDKFKLMVKFNETPEEFDYDEVLSELGVSTKK